MCICASQLEQDGQLASYDCCHIWYPHISCEALILCVTTFDKLLLYLVPVYAIMSRTKPLEICGLFAELILDNQLLSSYFFLEAQVRMSRQLEVYYATINSFTDINAASGV